MRPFEHYADAVRDTVRMNSVAQHFATALVDLSWLTRGKLARYKREWARPGRLLGMINWYRASPLLVADPSKPVTDLPQFDPSRLQVRCPHLLIWRVGDTALLAQTRDGLEHFAQDLTVEEIHDADHWVLHQRPEAVAQAIVNWGDG